MEIINKPEEFFSTEAGAEILALAIESLKADTPPSIQAIDRRLSLGYRMAADVLCELARRGIVSAVQADGCRRYLGEGEAGREAFKKLAAELNAGLEPAAHWWRKLSPAKRRFYLPGVDERANWADLSPGDMVRARSVYWRNKDKFAALYAEFAGV